MRYATHLLTAFVFSADLAGQGLPGTNIQLDVSVVSVVRRADTTVVTYVLTNRAASAEQLLTFAVDAPTVLTASQPLPISDWLRWTRYRGQSVARWTVLSSTILTPGTTGPPLTFTALGIPAIVNARIQGYFEGEVYADAVDAPLEDPFLDRWVVVRVVGVGPAPAGATDRDLTVRLSGLRAEACQLGWVDNHGICNSLQSKLDGAVAAFDRGDRNAALNKLDAFVHELDAQRGKHVNDSGYYLLKLNADLIRTGPGS